MYFRNYYKAVSVSTMYNREYHSRFMPNAMAAAVAATNTLM